MSDPAPAQRKLCSQPDSQTGGALQVPCFKMGLNFLKHGGALQVSWFATLVRLGRAGPPQHHIIIFDRCYIITFDSHAKLHAFREILPQCQSATSFLESRTSYKKQLTVAILQITKCFIPVLQNGSKFPVLQNGSIMSNLQGVAVFQKEKRKIGFSQRPLADSSHRLVECSLIC